MTRRAADFCNVATIIAFQVDTGSSQERTNLAPGVVGFQPQLMKKPGNGRTIHRIPWHVAKFTKYKNRLRPLSRSKVFLMINPIDRLRTGLPFTKMMSSARTMIMR